MNRFTTTTFLTLASIAVICPCQSIAGEKISTNYTIITAAIDRGGCKTGSTKYTNIGSVGLISGTSTSQTNVVNKSGYISQLYDVEGFSISLDEDNIYEHKNCSIFGYAHLDDGSFLLLQNQTILWKVMSGPVIQISNTGIATIGSVFKLTTAQVQASWRNYKSQTAFNILNVGNDDFDTYADDGIDDLWQVQYFGLSNPTAGAHRDPDGDGNDNTMEFLSGNNPQKNSSTFRPVEKFDNSTLTITFPTITGRIYTLKTSSSLTQWNLHTQFTGDGSDKIIKITDLDNRSHLFYYVTISNNL